MTRFSLAFVLVPAVMLATPATAAVGPAPFAEAPVGDALLADTRGTAGLTRNAVYRIADAAAADYQRQTGSLTATIKDLWLIDVASPLIGANVRAAGGID